MRKPEGSSVGINYHQEGTPELTYLGDRREMSIDGAKLAKFDTSQLTLAMLKWRTLSASSVISIGRRFL
jgi:hypothetical protein